MSGAPFPCRDALLLRGPFSFSPLLCVGKVGGCITPSPSPSRLAPVQCI